MDSVNVLLGSGVVEFTGRSEYNAESSGSGGSDRRYELGIECSL
jgi:hypothetical protein